MTTPMTTFVVEYPCDRHCRGEFDLTDIGNARYTYGRMRRDVDELHGRLHEDSARLEVTDVRGVITVVGAPAPADPLGVGGRR